MAEDRTAGSRPGGDTADETGRQVPDQGASGTTPFSQQVGRVVLVAIAVLFVVFAVVNSQRVTFDWLFGQTAVVERGGEYVGGGIPLIVLLIGSFVIGAIVGAGLLWRQRRVGRAERRSEERADI